MATHDVDGINGGHGTGNEGEQDVQEQNVQVPDVEDEVFQLEDLIPPEKPEKPTGKPEELLSSVRLELEQTRNLGTQWEQYARSKEGELSALRAELAALRAQSQPAARQRQDAPAVKPVPDGVEDPHVAGLYRELHGLKQQLAALNGGLPEVVDKKLQQLQVSIDAKEYTRAIGAAAARVNVDGLPWASETEIRQLMLTRDLDADQAADMVATARKQKFQAGGMRIAKRREQVQGTPSFRNAPTSFSIAKPPKTFGELDGIISDAINKALDANLG